MKHVSTIADMKAACRHVQRNGKTLGFVPTMGALHEGHLALVRAAKSRCDLTAVSIFVNPLQFGPSEDLGKYPRTLELDAQRLDELGVDLLFVPGVDEMYPSGAKTYVLVEASATSSTERRVPDTFAELRPWWRNCLSCPPRLCFLRPERRCPGCRSSQDGQRSQP